MANDPRIDVYIANAPSFARPILEHLRALVHEALPDAEETMKWSRPHFTVNGKNVAGMSAFKAHCAFGVHGDEPSGEGMGQYGKLTALSDLPSDATLAAALREGRRRVLETGSALPRKAARPPRPEIPMPEDFAAALEQVPAARAHLAGFAPSHRREYLEWITDAKSAATRGKRIVQAVAWLSEGRKRNWKYETC